MNLFQNTFAYVLMLAAAFSMVAGIYVCFSENGKNYLAELRERFRDNAPTDPQYNQARALFADASVNDSKAAKSNRADSSDSYDSGGDGGGGGGD